MRVILTITVVVVVSLLKMLATSIERREKKTPVQSSYQDIRAIYFHEERKYSLAVAYGQELKIVPVYISDTSTLKILMDVPEGKPMHLEYNGYVDVYGTIVADYVMHIHNQDDVTGAGWDHGKFGRGQTQRIGQ